ncbi:hypothetical protein SK128_001418, partial [Halocaridina rubra]
IVIRLIPSMDKVIRSAIVRACDTDYVRPLCKLITLELHHELVPEVQPVAPPDTVTVPTAPPRHKHSATKKAENLHRDLVGGECGDL